MTFSNKTEETPKNKVVNQTPQYCYANNGNSPTADKQSQLNYPLTLHFSIFLLLEYHSILDGKCLSCVWFGLRCALLWFYIDGELLYQGKTVGVF